MNECSEFESYPGNSELKVSVYSELEPVWLLNSGEKKQSLQCLSCCFVLSCGINTLVVKHV